jgi:cellulose synthase/poly-beta-1,6-N-acetylglucosamine synthase-like glycosyltransferase
MWGGRGFISCGGCAIIPDYPTPKLDIKLVVESDDQETFAALAALKLSARYDVIVAPPGAPRTKPRALNMALAAARGELITVYDAEDRPAPGQLREAVAFFAANADVDCIQAALTIGNPSDSWLAEMFAVEYAILFDIFNPGLSALRLPMALGGTSNHFRLASLRAASGWDAWNVTEDADLGIRMARLGMQIQTLGSDTVEEAPHEFGNWFRQRVRWQKGWMQTVIVHSRDPFVLNRQLGGWGALSAAALIVGGLSGGLFGTAFFAETLARLVVSAVAPGYSNLWYGDIVTIGLLLWGVQTLVVPAALAMRRRRMPGLTRVLAGMPLYFALITLATWQALFDLVFRPYYWAKTEHGREKSRFARREPDQASALRAGE